MSYKILLLFALVVLSNCTTYGGRVMGQYPTITGTYRVIKSNQATVQHIFEAYGGNPKIFVEGCTIWERDEIWYCTENGLVTELENIQSYKDLRRAAIRDSRIANSK